MNVWNVRLINVKYGSLKGKRGHNEDLLDHLRCVINDKPEEFDELKRLIDEAVKGAKQL